MRKHGGNTTYTYMPCVHTHTRTQTHRDYYSYRSIKTHKNTPGADVTESGSQSQLDSWWIKI